MLRESDVPRFWELVCTYPTDTDYMAGLVLHALEKGGKIPNLETAEKIAAVFGLGVLDLLQGPEHAEIIYRFGRLTPEQRVEVCEKVKGMIL